MALQKSTERLNFLHARRLPSTCHKHRKIRHRRGSRRRAIAAATKKNSPTDKRSPWGRRSRCRWRAAARIDRKNIFRATWREEGHPDNLDYGIPHKNLRPRARKIVPGRGLEIRHRSPPATPSASSREAGQRSYKRLMRCSYWPDNPPSLCLFHTRADSGTLQHGESMV